MPPLRCQGDSAAEVRRQSHQDHLPVREAAAHAPSAAPDGGRGPREQAVGTRSCRSEVFGVS